MLFSVLILSASPSQVPQKLDFFNQKAKASSLLFEYKSKAKKNNKSELVGL